MALKVVNTESLDAVANAINSKAGTSGALQFPDGFVSAVEGISAGGGGGELPTLFTPSISFLGTAQISISDGGNGDFVDKYEVYIDGVKSGEVTSRKFAIADITASNKTIEIFVKAIANLFNASETSNVVVRIVAEGTEGLAYSLSSNGTYYTCDGIGTATETDIVIANEIDGLPVRYLKTEAFLNNKNITSVVIPENLTNTPTRAFYSCPSLKSVVIRGGWITEYSQAETFYDCKALTSVDLGASTIIGGYMFVRCAFSNIKIPRTVTKIQQYAFYGISNLEYVDMTDYGTTDKFPSIYDAGVFGSCPSTFEIRVKSGRKAELSAMTNWSTYADKIVEV